MRDYALLLFALFLFPFVLTIGMLIHIVKELRLWHLFSMRSYAYNIALHLDKAGGLELGTKDFTLNVGNEFWVLNLEELNEWLEVSPHSNIV